MRWMSDYLLVATLSLQIVLIVVRLCQRDRANARVSVQLVEYFRDQHTYPTSSSLPS